MNILESFYDQSPDSTSKKKQVGKEILTPAASRRKRSHQTPPKQTHEQTEQARVGSEIITEN
ncbi:hypothetical protein YC2023_036423 [Brassica napus]